MELFALLVYCRKRETCEEPLVHLYISPVRFSVDTKSSLYFISDYKFSLQGRAKV